MLDSREIYLYCSGIKKELAGLLYARKSINTAEIRTIFI
jgi:hypothetical protein